MAVSPLAVYTDSRSYQFYLFQLPFPETNTMHLRFPLRSCHVSGCSTRPAHLKRFYTPRLEWLESRLALATVFTVTNTDDSGPGSLRQAILDANAAADPPTIEFQIPIMDANFIDADSSLPGGDSDPDVFVIAPKSTLPALTRDATTIDGSSQKALTGNSNPYGPEIVLAGNLAGATVNGLQLASSANVLRELNIQGFSDNGVLVEGDANRIMGSYIGTSATAMAEAGNGGAGILIDGGSGNIVGGSEFGARNILSGNVRGVHIRGATATENQVAGNYVGLGADGAALLPNGVGVLVQGTAAGNVIGGTHAAERNVISANQFDNIFLAATLGTTVQGNYVGTDAAGTETTAYAQVGIRLGNDRYSLIGGSTSGAGNLVSGNFYGIYVGGSLVTGGSQGIRIEGNRIGTTADGQDALANFQGIYLDGFDDGSQRFAVHNVAIGGTGPGAGNLVSGNQIAGIVVQGPNATGITIRGNRIGTDKDGTTALLNGAGVLLHNARDVLVGGEMLGSDNIIAFNAQAGVRVTQDTSVGNTIRGNAIHSNGGLGIELGSDGVTSNDQGDGDVGANDLQNFPVLTAVQAGASTQVAGTLNSTANATFTLDFYASSAADPSGYGEGERWLGAITVVTDGSGDANFVAGIAATTIPSEFITATATNAAGNTSEFSSSRETTSIAVSIYIRPDSDNIAINLATQGVLAVAMLTSTDFDAALVDTSTVMFAGAATVHSALEDVDGDGDLDMILHFRIQDTNLRALYTQLLLDDLDGDGVLDSNHQVASVTLTGQTVDEVLFAGTEDLDLFLAGKNLRTLLESLLQ